MNLEELKKVEKEEKIRIEGLDLDPDMHITENQMWARCLFQWRMMMIHGWTKHEFKENYPEYSDRVFGCWACMCNTMRKLKCSSCVINWGVEGIEACYDNMSPFNRWSIIKVLDGYDADEVNRNLMKYHASQVLRHMLFSWEPTTAIFSVI